MWTQAERRQQVFIFSDLKGLARYFGRVFPIAVIKEEVQVATRDFRHRQFSGIDQTQLEFLKLCETRLVRRARELQVAL